MSLCVYPWFDPSESSVRVTFQLPPPLVFLVTLDCFSGLGGFTVQGL